MPRRFCFGIRIDRCDSAFCGAIRRCGRSPAGVMRGYCATALAIISRKQQDAFLWPFEGELELTGMNSHGCNSFWSPVSERLHGYVSLTGRGMTADVFTISNTISYGLCNRFYIAAASFPLPFERPVPPTCMAGRWGGAAAMPCVYRYETPAVKSVIMVENLSREV